VDRFDQDGDGDFDKADAVSFVKKYKWWVIGVAVAIVAMMLVGCGNAMAAAQSENDKWHVGETTVARAVFCPNKDIMADYLQAMAAEADTKVFNCGPIPVPVTFKGIIPDSPSFTMPDGEVILIAEFVVQGMTVYTGMGDSYVSDLSLEEWKATPQSLLAEPLDPWSYGRWSI
jgi:hypothetical protein